MVWQFHNDAPIYSQIVSQFRLAIASGEYQPGERVPGVRELAMEAGVNPNTMQRAMQELERMDLIYSVSTAGRYITDQASVIAGERDKMARGYVEQFISQMSALGFSPVQIFGEIRKAVEEECK